MNANTKRIIIEIDDEEGSDTRSMSMQYADTMTAKHVDLGTIKSTRTAASTGKIIAQVLEVLEILER